MAHIVHYRTRLSEPTVSDDDVYKSYAFDKVAEGCREFSQAVPSFIEFPDTGDPALQLTDRTTTREGNHRVTLSDEIEISHCPFCGAEIELEEGTVIDARD